MNQLKSIKRHRFTVAEYHRMGDTGLFRDQRVELVAGEVIEMAPQRDDHVIALSLSAKAIAVAFGAGYWVRNQAPINLGKYDDPEPDITVVIGTERDYIGSKNRVTALLVVEIADTTLRYDRGRKARRYARAGIADYWIVNLVNGQIEVFREPQSVGTRHEYARTLIFQRGQSVIPLAAPHSPVRVDDLLP